MKWHQEKAMENILFMDPEESDPEWLTQIMHDLNVWQTPVSSTETIQAEPADIRTALWKAYQAGADSTD